MTSDLAIRHDIVSAQFVEMYVCVWRLGLESDNMTAKYFVALKQQVIQARLCS